MAPENGTHERPEHAHRCWPPHRLRYPVEEAAVLIGIADRTLWDLIDAGLVERTWCGHRAGVHIDEIKRFIQALPTVKPESTKAMIQARLAESVAA